jgi:Uri superfamily endonuclease
MPKKRIYKGSYCLIIKLAEDSDIKVGSLGIINFTRGYYVYVGSALNSLEGRLKRHWRPDKKIHWHVDYLLNNKNASLIDVVYAVDDGKWECLIAAALSKKGGETSRFGCSDCKCGSHLFKFEDFSTAVSCSRDSFESLALNPIIWSDGPNFESE